MSEEDRSYSGVDEEEEEEEEAGLKLDKEAVESTVPNEQVSLEEQEEDEEEEPTTEAIIEEEVDEEEELDEEEEPKPKLKRGQRRKKAKSRAREPESSLNLKNVEKQLEKQAEYLTKLESELQPLRRLAKSSDMHSKLIKDINNSVKQMGKQIVQIQKVIQKGKGKKK